jgi:hypothetical protein
MEGNSHGVDETQPQNLLKAAEENQGILIKTARSLTDTPGAPFSYRSPQRYGHANLLG